MDSLEVTVEYKELLACKGTITSLLGCMMAMICLIFMDPTLSVRLTELGMNENNVGIAFAMMGMSFGLGASFAGWICTKLSRLLVMQLGLLLLGASCLLIGPSVVLNLPNKIWIILIGVSANAFFGAWLVVPVTPQIIANVEIELKAKWRKDCAA